MPAVSARRAAPDSTDAGSSSAAATCGAHSTAASVRSNDTAEVSSIPVKNPLARCTAAGVTRCGTILVPEPWRLSAIPSSRSSW